MNIYRTTVLFIIIVVIIGLLALDAQNTGWGLH